MGKIGIFTIERLDMKTSVFSYTGFDCSTEMICPVPHLCPSKARQRHRAREGELILNVTPIPELQLGAPHQLH